MRKPDFTFLNRLWATCGAAAFLALPACSDFSRAAAPPAMPSDVGSAARTPGTCNGKLVVLSDQKNSVVNFYKQAGKNQSPCFQLTSANGVNAPTGLAVDPSDALYVGNGDGTIVKYVKPYTGAPTLICTLPTGYPYGLAVDTSGTVYAGDFDGYSNFSNDITKCHGKRSSQLVDTQMWYVFVVAVDSHGDIFDDGLDTNANGIVDESTDAGSTWKRLQNGNLRPGGLALDAKDNLYVNDVGDGQTTARILTFGPPYTGPAVDSFSYQGLDTHIALNGANSNIWGASTTTDAGVKYRLPGGKILSSTAPMGVPGGVATIPASLR